jgi:hypothetical protein
MPAQQDFVVSLDSFQIFDTTSPHNDTDYVYFTVKVGDQMFGPMHAGLGSLNNGVYPLSWKIPIAVADDATPIVISYQIVNNGAGDQHQQIQNDAAILGGIGNVLQGVGAVVGAIEPIGGIVVGVIGSAVGAIGNAIQAIDGMLDCDQAIVNDVLLTTRSTILGSIGPTGRQSVTRDYRTPGRGGGIPIWLHCRTAHYAVTWSITEVVSAQHVFASNVAGELIHYYWSPQPSWAAENLTQDPAYRLAGRPSVINLQSGEPMQHVFARNADGELVHYYWWPQPGWAAENITKYPNIGPASRFVGDPRVINLQSGDLPTQHVFARNAAGELVHYYWSPQPGWAAENLTRYPNIGAAYQFVGDPQVVNLQSGDLPTQHVFARNAAGELIHYYWSPQPGWAAENLTRYPNIGAAYQFASDPRVINLQSGNEPTQHVFARNAAGELVHYYWSPQPGWAAENLTRYPNIGAAYQFAGDPLAINLQSGNEPTQHVFARNAAGELIHYYWSPQPGWAAENLTRYPNIGAAYQFVGDPLAINLQSGNEPTQHVFARNAAGEVIHYYWSPQPGWAAENLTRYPNIGAAYQFAGAPLAINLQSGNEPTQHVFARNAAGELIHYYWSPQPGWAAENLTERDTIGAARRFANDPSVINFILGQL